MNNTLNIKEFFTEFDMSDRMTALQAKQKKEEEDLKVKIAHEELERQ